MTLLVAGCLNRQTPMETRGVFFQVIDNQTREFPFIYREFEMLENSEPAPQHHKKTLHSKRSFGKYPHKIDSPAYDASVIFIFTYRQKSFVCADGFPQV
jgi:hypothetical protein